MLMKILSYRLLTAFFAVGIALPALGRNIDQDITAQQAKRIEEITTVYRKVLKNLGSRQGDANSLGVFTALINNSNYHWDLGNSKSQKENQILKYLSPFFSEKNLQIKLPETAPLSGAEVLIIKSNNQAIGVLKLMFEKGVDEILNALLANEIFKSKKLNVVETLAIGTFEEGKKVGHYILMSLARGKPIDQMIQKESPEVQMAIQSLAKAIGEFHRLTHIKLQELPTKAQQAALRNLAYEANKLYTQGKLDDTKFAKLDWLGNEAFINIIKKSAEDYHAIVTNKEFDKLYCSSVHGDAHVGNFFFDPQKQNLDIIDPETMTWSLKGDSNSAEDIGRVLGSIYINAYASPQVTNPQKLTQDLEKLFLDTYFEALNVNETERKNIQLAIDYMKNKYLWLNTIEDYVNKKGDLYKQKMIELVADVAKS